MGVDLTFKGPITFLYCELAFSKVKDSINICLNSRSAIILFTDEVSLCKNSVKASFQPYKILVKA